MAISDPIQHIVVLMLENQSFDRMLGCLKSVYASVEGVDSDAPQFNPDFPVTNPPISQTGTTSDGVNPDPNHGVDSVLRQIDGPCQGFVSDYAQAYPQTTAEQRQEIMAYYNLGSLPVIHAMARSFGVCDHWFASVPGPTWTNRFFVHSGTSLGWVKMPNGMHDPNIHFWDQTTVYDRLSEKGISWKIYYHDFPHSLLLVHQLEHPFSYSRMEGFFQDAKCPASKFPQYSFIEPAYFEPEENDQHPPTSVTKGEALLAQVYNALRANSELWSCTLLVVIYDEHGGFYDHVSPPLAVPPDGHTEEYTFDRLGVRVPAILVSPWARAGVISTVLDHTSLLKYVTEKWNLGSLGERTAAANSFGVEFQKLGSPRGDTPGSISVPQIAPTPALRAGPPVPLNQHQQALIAYAQYLESRMAHLEPPETIVRRMVEQAEGPENQAAIAKERVERFLELKRKGAKLKPFKRAR